MWQLHDVAGHKVRRDRSGCQMIVIDRCDAVTVRLKLAGKIMLSVIRLESELEDCPGNRLVCLRVKFFHPYKARIAFPGFTERNDQIVVVRRTQLSGNLTDDIAHDDCLAVDHVMIRMPELVFGRAVAPEETGMAVTNVSVGILVIDKPAA